MNSIRLVFAAFSAALMLGSAGCAATASSEGPDQGPAIPAEVPTDAVSLTVETGASQAVMSDITLQVLSGHVRLSESDSTLHLDELQIVIDDIVLNKDEATLKDTVLHGMSVKLKKPIDAPLQQSESGTRFTSIDVDLLVDWSLKTSDGAIVPLAQQEVNGVKLNLGIYTDDEGRLVADINGGKEGTIWEWASLTTLDNLQFDIHAAL